MLVKTLGQNGKRGNYRMNQNNTQQFKGIMTGLYETFDRTPSPTLTEVYYNALAEFDIADVERAAINAIQNCRFFPKPAELREFLLESPGDQAQRAWTLLVEATRKVGMYNSLWIEDMALAQAVILTFGGWVQACSALASLSPEMVASKRKEFTHNYQLVRRRGDSEADRYFLGHAEANNRSSVGGWKRGTFPENRFYQPVGIIGSTRVALIRLAYDARTGAVEPGALKSMQGGGAKQLVGNHLRHLQILNGKVERLVVDMPDGPDVTLDEFIEQAEGAVDSGTLMGLALLRREQAKRKGLMLPASEVVQPTDETERLRALNERRALLLEQAALVKEIVGEGKEQVPALLRGIEAVIEREGGENE